MKMTFKVPEKQQHQHPFKSITLKEIDGKDIAAAEELAAAKSDDAMKMFKQTGVEKLRRSIVAVDGVSVEQPYLGFDEWKEKTRNLINAAYNELNSVSTAEIDAFLKGGTVEA